MGADKYSEEELADALVDWYFGEGRNIHFDLEKKGYKWQFFGENIESHDGFGEHALVVDEFPLGDLLYTKKLVKPLLWSSIGLVPILSTKTKAYAQLVMRSFAEDEMIEMIDRNRRIPWAAVVHRCARPTCEWQGSIFDERGPVTHVEADTKEDAVMQLFEESRNWEPHRGAIDVVFTKMDEFRYPLHRRS
jgi:hypothetical protein